MDISTEKKHKTKRPPEKSLRFPVAVHTSLLRLCSKHGLSQVDLFTAMVTYFDKTKKDPRDINDELLKNTLIRNHDTYIRFIRKQEDMILIPLRETGDKLIVNQREIVRYFNEQVLTANTEILKKQDAAISQGQQLTDLLQSMHRKLDQKEKLKARFLQLFNQYVSQREELGSFKQRERDELTATMRQRINEL